MAMDSELLQQLNSANSKRYLHKFGRGVGFCAEYNNVVNSLIKCLNQGFSFNFEGGGETGVSTGLGWEDYFIGFCPSIHNPLASWNSRGLGQSRKYALIRPVIRLLLKRITSCDAFMFDEVSYGALNTRRINAILEDDAVGLIASELWKFSPETSLHVSNTLVGSRIGEMDLGLHIRRGDKREEFNYTPVSRYIEFLEPYRGQDLTMFVATDDETVVSELHDAIKQDFTIYTAKDLIKPYSEKSNPQLGYQQRKFNDLPLQTRRLQVRDLITEMELLRRCRVFIGSSTSNVFITVRNIRTTPSTDLTEGAWKPTSRLRLF